MNNRVYIALLLAGLQVNTMAADIINPLQQVRAANTDQTIGAISYNKDIKLDDDSSEKEVSASAKEGQTATEVRYTEPIIKPIGKCMLTVDLKGKSIFLNGERISSAGKCIVKDDISYVPLKAIVNGVYGGELTYNKGTGYVEADINGLALKYKLGSKQGFKNGNITSIALPMILHNGSVYCPVKSIPTLFSMTMTYDTIHKKIIMTGPDRFKPLVITSFADFEFEKNSYVQGQKICAIDKSYDISERNIVSYQWQLDHDKEKVSSQLNSLFEHVLPGTHAVSLKVKNDAGVWSQWETRTVEIIKNEKPVITKLVSAKKAYAQGEKIELDYECTNEAWEKISEEKWYYKRVGEEDKSKVYLKPEYIFCQGDYEVGLQVKDEYGNWSDNYIWTMHITDEVKDTELNFKFQKNIPGMVIDNFEGRNYRDFEKVDMTLTGKDEGTYILSDSPENVTQNGILYEDYIDGKGRINFHHINSYPSSPKKRKIVVMAQNVTSKPITITLMDKIIKGPSIDALYVGQLLLYQYFRGNGHATYTLKPGQKILMINTEDKTWDKDMLIAGQMDLYTSGKVKFTVAAADKGMTTANIPYLPYLSTCVHPRGTYDTTDLYYEVTADGDKETYFVVGESSEEWCTGRDAIKKKEVVNVGNYGIVYHIKITADEDIGILLNPRGGAFRGAVRIDGIYTYMMPNKNNLSADSTKAAVVTTVKKGNTVELEYSLPNGSSAPVLFAMIPEKFWKTKSTIKK